MTRQLLVGLCVYLSAHTIQVIGELSSGELDQLTESLTGSARARVHYRHFPPSFLQWVSRGIYVICYVKCIINY